ncbi:MAG: methyltransferase domain-containing protein [Bacteroidetes bacterium]|nr:methyltransferase domain-containing protein [Bacteroidota bacterium]
MENELNYIEKNKESWNKRTGYHVKSAFYDLDGFLKGASSLNEIELKLLGDIKGKSILHLQCHFGQDSISLARLGAQVTGIDLSDIAIDTATSLAKETQTSCKFICCNIYDLPKHLTEKFDIVFTSYGTIGWLPDLNKWAQLISTYLKLEGKFIFAEFHPVVWMFDNDFKTVQYNYFNSGAIIETEIGTYADRSAPIKQEFVTWNHSTSEVLTSLIANGLKIESFEEFDYSPHNCFTNTTEFEPKKYRITHLGNKIPMVFALTATKIS